MLIVKQVPSLAYSSKSYPKDGDIIIQKQETNPTEKALHEVGL